MFRNIIFLFVFLFVKSLCINDYYWRDYTGIIPEDAIPGGHDINDEETYIGLVYLSNEGVYPATIYRGKKEAFAPADEIRQSENFIQILCTEYPENIRWIQTNKTDFHFITMNKHLIRGGVQDKNWLHIGRINYQGEIVIGKVLSGRAGLNDAFMSFIHNNEEKVAFSYEVLTFVNSRSSTNPKKDAEVFIEPA